MTMQKLNFFSKLISIHQHFDSEGGFSHYYVTLIQTSLEGLRLLFTSNLEVGDMFTASGKDVFFNDEAE